MNKLHWLIFSIVTGRSSSLPTSVSPSSTNFFHYRAGSFTGWIRTSGISIRPIAFGERKLRVPAFRDFDHAIDHRRKNFLDPMYERSTTTLRPSWWNLRAVQRNHTVAAPHDSRLKIQRRLFSAEEDAEKRKRLGFTARSNNHAIASRSVKKRILFLS